MVRQTMLYECRYSLYKIELLELIVSVTRMNKVYLRENNGFKMQPHDCISLKEFVNIEEHTIYSDDALIAVKKARNRLAKNDSFSNDEKKSIFKELEKLEKNL